MADELMPIQNRIYAIRGKRVMLDSDLAYLYEVEAKRLNEAVKRNQRRFPNDFMFQLTKDEIDEVVAICDHLERLKYRPTLPYAFTEQGVAMLASVLNSQKAIDVNIQIMRAFIQLRNYALSEETITEQIAVLRKLLMLGRATQAKAFAHFLDNLSFSFAPRREKFFLFTASPCIAWRENNDEKVNDIIAVLNYLIEEPKVEKPKETRKIGFITD